MKLKSTSFKLTEKRLANLKVIAASFGCRYNDAPSIGEMLNQIADGNLDIRRAVSGLSNMFPSIASNISSVQQPTAIPIQPPAWNAPVAGGSGYIPICTSTKDGRVTDWYAPVATSLKVSDLPPQDFGTYAMHHSPKKSEFVTDRGDGTFVDTEEFDKPVPQKRVPVTEPTEASVVKPISISVGMSKEEKRAMFEQLKGLGSAIKKGSEL